MKNIYNNACDIKKIKFEYLICHYWLNNQIYSDSNRIIQVLVCLIDNSMKFTKQNGNILIKVSDNFEYDTHYM